MKNRFYCLLCIVIIVSFVSCDPVEVGGGENIMATSDTISPSYVAEYLSVETLYVECFAEDITTYILRYRANSHTVNLFSQGEDKYLFDSLAAKHHDTNYYHSLEYFILAKSFHNFASFADLVSIEVTSEEAWDDLHPAGASLNDLFTFHGTMAQEFIDSDYADDSTGFDVPKIKLLSEMSQYDYSLQLSSREPYIHLESLPAVAQPYSLKFKFMLDDGREFVTPLKINFGRVQFPQ